MADPNNPDVADGDLPPLRNDTDVADGDLPPLTNNTDGLGAALRDALNWRTPGSTNSGLHWASDPANPLGPGGTPTGAPGWGVGSGSGSGSGSAPGTTPTTPVTPPPGPDTSARGVINNFLGQYGLSTLADWAWGQFLDGVPISQLMLDLRSRPEYKQRFPAMDVLAGKGRAISEQAYVEYERSASQLMHAAGLPAGFWDQPQDFAALLGGEVSLSELQNRIGNAYLRVAHAPAEVRDAFGGFYGANSDSALAAFFLDPDRAQPILERAVQEAEVAGTGKQFGFSLNQQQASGLAQHGVDLAAARRGFADLAQSRPLYSETVSEGTDLTAEQQGLGAAFGTNAADAAAVRQRFESRQAQMSGANAQQSPAGIGTASY